MRAIKYAGTVFAGLILYFAVFERQWGMAITSKAAGGNQPCPWPKLMALPWNVARFASLQKASLGDLALEQEDSTLGIEQFKSSTRRFWIKKDGKDLDGKHLLAYILAEQTWLSEYNHDRGVRKGDVVVDVGAHIGTFGDDALRRGASKVIMIEPDPVNLECIRRNFPIEIADGRVVLISKGAWSKADTLEFDLGESNSGTGSLVVKDSQKRIKVFVDRLDDMLRSARVDRIDFIKMDIEGAEREALKGASGVLAKWKPRLMMDSYHLPDDDVVLPAVIAALNPAYHSNCAVCYMSNREKSSRIVPYAVFYE